MKLSTRTRYGARAMVELARAEGSIPVKEIARRQRLSIKYLESIMSSLKQAGLVRSVRGMHGGYELTRPAADIMLKEVFVALEGDLVLVDCLRRPDRCPSAPECPTRRVWKDMNALIVDFLAGKSLSDLSSGAGVCDLTDYDI